MARDCFSAVLSATPEIPSVEGYRPSRFVIREYKENNEVKYAVHQHFLDELAGFGYGEYFLLYKNAHHNMWRRYEEKL